MISLRAEATSCIGKIAAGICKTQKQIFGTLITPLIDVVFDGMVNLDDYEIREHSYAFFYCAANVLGAEFEPLLEKLVGFAFKSISSKDGMKKVKEKTGDFSLDTDSENDEEELTPGAGVKVQMSWLDEKAAAIHALGEFATSCCKGFSPYYQETLKHLEEVADHFYANVRQQTVVCYKNLTEALVKVAFEGQLPQYECGLPCVQRLPAKIEEFIKIELLTKFFYVIENDESKEVVAATLEVLNDLINHLGPAFIDKSHDDLVKSINMLLKNEAVCQATDEDVISIFNSIKINSNRMMKMVT